MVMIKDFIESMCQSGNSYERVKYVKAQYKTVDDGLTNAHIIMILKKIADEYNKREMVLFFGPRITSVQEFADILGTMNDNCNKKNCIESIWRNLEDLNGDNIAELLCKINDDSYKKNSIYIMKTRIRTTEALVNVLDTLNDDSNKKNVIEELWADVRDLDFENIKRIVCRIYDDSNRKNVMETMKSRFYCTHIIPLITLLKSDSYRMNIIEMLSGRTSDEHKLYIEDVYKMLALMNDDSGKLKIITMFKGSFNAPNVPTLLNSMGDDSNKFKIIDLLCVKIAGDLDAYGLVTCFKVNSHRQFIRKMQDVVRPRVANMTECLDKFVDEKDRLQVLENIKAANVYNTPEGLVKLVSLFSTDRAKLNAVRIKLPMINNMAPEAIRAIKLFEDPKYYNRAFREFIAKVHPDTLILLELMEFTVIPNRLKMLDKYASSNHIDRNDLAFTALIKQLESIENANTFLIKYNYQDVSGILVQASYNLDDLGKQQGPISDSDSDMNMLMASVDVSNDDSDEPIEEFDYAKYGIKISDDDDNVAEINIHDVRFNDKIAKSYAPTKFKNGIAYFDIEEREVINLDGLGQMSFNGIDPVAVIRDGIRRHVKRAMKEKEKFDKEVEAKKQARISKTWKDVEVEDGDKDNACIVCMMNKRQMTFMPCGHFRTCFACTATIIKKSPYKCPMCNQVAQSIARIFA